MSGVGGLIQDVQLVSSSVTVGAGSAPNGIFSRAAKGCAYRQSRRSSPVALEAEGYLSGIRHVGGAKLDQAFVWNVRTCASSRPMT